MFAHFRLGQYFSKTIELLRRPEDDIGDGFYAIIDTFIFKFLRSPTHLNGKKINNKPEIPRRETHYNFWLICMDENSILFCRNSLRIILTLWRKKTY